MSFYDEFLNLVMMLFEEADEEEWGTGYMTYDEWLESLSDGLGATAADVYKQLPEFIKLCIAEGDYNFSFEDDGM